MYYNETRFAAGHFQSIVRSKSDLALFWEKERRRFGISQRKRKSEEQSISEEVLEKSRKSDFSNHTFAVNQRQKVRQLERMFNCKSCGNEFNSSFELKQHSENFHDANKTVKCFSCEECFNSKASRDKHYRTKHTNPVKESELAPNDENADADDRELENMRLAINLSQKPSFEYPEVQEKVKARLEELGFMLSPTNPKTKADGNCFVYGLMDQLR